MARYLARRLVYSVIALWLVTTVTFFLMHAIPGDPFSSEKVTPSIHQLMLEKYGLDKPLLVQYGDYLLNLLHGDLGISMRQTNRSVNDMIRDGFPVSAQLGLEALLFAVIVGVTLGTVASLHRNGVLDYTAVLLSLLFVSVPSFVFATVLQYVVGVRLGWLPVARWEGFSYTILPAFSLGIGMLGSLTRLMRTSMLEVVGQDYIRTARAKGLSSWSVVGRHMWRNAILPLVTVLGPLTAGIITGTLIIETIFGVPGLGKYYVESIYNRDYTLIMGTTVFYAGLLIAANFIVDLLYGVIDPRIRLAERG
ncbi:MAG: ABC transporter permease [Limnochordaceae bacterium]|nr:ABC transporter permease [Limnochordaceae bacterium]